MTEQKMTELNYEWLKKAVRKRGYLRCMEACALGERWERGERILLFDRNSECWKKTCRGRQYKPKARVLPGDWFAALTTLLFIPHCSACAIRKKWMNRVGWRGLLKLLLMPAFWRGDWGEVGSRAGCPTCGKKRKDANQWQPLTGSAAPTPT